MTATTFISVLNNSQTDVEGHEKFLNRLFAGGVPTGFSGTSMQVVQRGAGANMSVDVSVGDVHLELPATTYSFWGWQTALANVVITTAPVSNSRIDAIVAWCDPSVVTTATPNSPGALKFSAIVGTVAGSPVAPLDAAIQTALGSTIAWTRLGNVTVGTSVTSIVTANISDKRTAVSLRAALAANSVADSQISGVSASKLTNPYKFSAYGSVATGLAAGFTATKITFGTKEYDTGSNFDAVTNNRFTAPVAGFYRFSAAYQSQSGATGEFYTIYLYKNGSLLKTGTSEISQGTGIINVTVSPPAFQLAASDYIEVFGAQNSGGIKNTTTGQSTTYFGGCLVSTT